MGVGHSLRTLRIPSQRSLDLILSERALLQGEEDRVLSTPLNGILMDEKVNEVSLDLANAAR